MLCFFLAELILLKPNKIKVLSGLKGVEMITIICILISSVLFLLYAVFDLNKRVKTLEHQLKNVSDNLADVMGLR